MYKIVIGGISTECSSYSPLFQKTHDFKRLEGDKLIQYIDFDFQKHNIEPKSIFFDFSLPGGPIKKSVYYIFHLAKRIQDAELAEKEIKIE